MVDGVRGIRVLDGEEANKYLEIINIFHNVAQKYDCAFIKIPTIEKDELFTRTVGENTDIVTKQMFSFPDKKGRNLVLRPEGTAGVVRHHIDKKYNKIKKECRERHKPKTTKKKRSVIPKALKNEVWDNCIGREKGIGNCCLLYTSDAADE